MATPQYIFRSERLGFRNWQPADIALLAAINADAAVMQFFPGVKTYAETEQFVTLMQQQYNDKGYCYFAVDVLATREFIGFIGISDQTFESPFTPCTDIGWRLATPAWGRGYATEGARACLHYAFATLRLPIIKAVAPIINQPSINVMQKIGMHETTDFIHPLLINDDRLKTCVLYEIVG